MTWMFFSIEKLLWFVLDITYSALSSPVERVRFEIERAAPILCMYVYRWYKSIVAWIANNTPSIRELYEMSSRKSQLIWFHQLWMSLLCLPLWIISRLWEQTLLRVNNVVLIKYSKRYLSFKLQYYMIDQYIRFDLDVKTFSSESNYLVQFCRMISHENLIQIIM